MAGMFDPLSFLAGLMHGQPPVPMGPKAMQGAPAPGQPMTPPGGMAPPSGPAPAQRAAERRSALKKRAAEEKAKPKGPAKDTARFNPLEARQRVLEGLSRRP